MKKIVIAENIIKSIGTDKAFFGRGGIVLYAVRTTEDILAFHRTRKADLIITDFNLPVQGGAKLIETIRSDAALREVSIILVCSNVESEINACREAGANAVLSTPLDPVVFFQKVSELILIPQRKDMRVLLRVSVSGGSGGASFFATSGNISLSGMLLETNHKFHLDDSLSCSFFIGHSEVAVSGRVVRVERTGSGRYLCGVRFQNLDAKTMIVIEQFVKNMKKHK